MNIILVKASGPGGRDAAWLTDGGITRRAAVHPVHDLPHLAVESAFGITDGLWAELAAGVHDEAGRAAAARDTRRNKHGRIVTGAAAGVPASQWLTPGHRRAKAVTNCVANRFGNGPDTPCGVRDRATAYPDPAAAKLIDGLDDATIDLTIAAVRDLLGRWARVPPGDALRLTWPLDLQAPGSTADW